MNIHYVWLPRSLACGLLLVVALSPLAAQTVPAAPSKLPRTRNVPKQDELVVRSETENLLDETPLVLSPFSVQGDAVVGYQAKTTLASTRLRTKVDDVGTALQIVTAQFLKDTGATDNQSLLSYTTGTEVGGFAGNFDGNVRGATILENSLSRPDLNTRIRGLSRADNTREFESTDIKWDSYNISSVEIQRGANTILFGLGSPSGLINASLKQAEFRNAGEVSIRFDGEGSIRSTLDLNQVILKDQLGLRVDLLKDNKKYYQKPAFNNDARAFATITFAPEILNRRSAHTTLRVSYEKGKIKSENPRTLAPVDMITPWFKTGTYTDPNGKVTNNLNKTTVDLRYGNLYFADTPGSGFALTSSPNYQPWIDSFYQGNFAYFSDPNSDQQTGKYMMSSFFYLGMNHGIGANGAIDGNIGGQSNQTMRNVATNAFWAIQAGVPFASNYVQSSLSDTSIFDFYNKLIDGPSRREGQDFEAINANLNQTFLNNHIGLEARFDRQHFHSSYSNPYGGSLAGINVDLNRFLTDGSPNPNVGRAFLLGDYLYGGNDSNTTRQSSRLTAFLDGKAEDLPFLGKDSVIARILGRHVLTGVISESSRNSRTISGAYSALAPTGGQSDPNAILGNSLDPYLRIKTISYLGPDMRSLSTAQGLNLSPVGAARKPTSTSLTVFDSKWNRPANPVAAGYVNPADAWYNPLLRTNSTQSENPANYVGWVTLPVQPLYWDTDMYRLATLGSLEKQTVDSKVFVWQGYMFDGNLIPIIGYRRDTAKAYSKSAPTLYNYAQLGSPSFVLPDAPFNTVKGINRTYSLVAHTPQFIRKHLPWGMTFSAFANKSKDFEPSAGRVDILNQPLPAPYGETEDYGITASAFNGRLALKVTKFKTTSAGASSGLTYMWVAGADVQRAWVLAKRYEAGLSGNPTYSGPTYNIGKYVNGVYTITPEDRSRQQAMVQATLSSPFINNPVFWKAWDMELGTPKGQTDARWQNLDLSMTIPPGMTGLQDEVSEGYEIEIYAKPTDNWDVTLNVAKVTAQKTNIFTGGANGAFLAEGDKLFIDGLVGQLPRYTGDAPVTLGDQWKQLVSTPLQQLRALNGSSNAEIRPWRCNLVTSYNFSEGSFKGTNIGLGYQWQDKVVIGYPSVFKTVNGVKSETIDIAKPYYGPSDDSVNLWIGYSRKITNKIAWHIQANVTNILGKNELIPINVQPDGSPGALRIKLGPSWTVTNSFSF
ncbi:MAG: TonB-dependent receptor plug domain-containing protein [Opitutaceae bacterium]|nr:TonB-dependent receptor plug domain-containing protein [Opitutaceae bacterium]